MTAVGSASFGPAGRGRDYSQPHSTLLAAITEGGTWPAFQPPTYRHDAGLDLALAEDVVIGPGDTVNAPTGVAVALPPGTWGLVTGRSSTWAKHGVQVMQGVIDEGWRGELRVLLFKPVTSSDLTASASGLALSPEGGALVLKRGTRVAQLIVLPNLLEHVKVICLPGGQKLPEGERGELGFGSSGS